MNLYFIAFTDDNGDSGDWFVVAPSRAKAVALWRTNGEYARSDKPRVFVVPAKVTGKARVLAWHSDVKEVER